MNKLKNYSKMKKKGDAIIIPETNDLILKPLFGKPNHSSSNLHSFI